MLPLDTMAAVSITTNGKAVDIEEFYFARILRILLTTRVDTT